jgi:hypothetical protein
MSAQAHIQPYVYGAIAILVLWRVYFRVRRLIGRQKFSAVRSWISAGFFPVLICLLFVSAFTHPLRAASELLGVAIGTGLGIYGLRLTKYEETADGNFYSPSAHIGIALSFLFVGRLAYKLVYAYSVTASFTQPPSEIIKSPLTLLIVGTLAGYYATYAAGLLVWNRKINGRGAVSAGQSSGA